MEKEVDRHNRAAAFLSALGPTGRLPRCPPLACAFERPPVESSSQPRVSHCLLKRPTTAVWVKNWRTRLSRLMLWDGLPLPCAKLSLATFLPGSSPSRLCRSLPLPPVWPPSGNSQESPRLRPSPSLPSVCLPPSKIYGSAHCVVL